MQDHHEPNDHELLLTLIGSVVALGLIALAGNVAPDLILSLIHRL